MITKTLGRYNLCSNDSQWKVAVRLPEDAPRRWISQTWPEEDEPDIDGEFPSEVVERIAKRLEHYLISTGRVEDRKVIEWAREHAEELDAQWAEDEIKRHEKVIEQLQARVAELRETVELLREVEA